MSTPKRIQRSRAKGWRMPEGAIYVGRPSRWGNPFALDVIHHAVACGLTTYGTPGGAIRIADDLLARPEWFLTTAEASVLLFRRFVELMPSAARAELLADLRGHDLACWCPLTTPMGNSMPCHADVLLELANR